MRRLVATAVIATAALAVPATAATAAPAPATSRTYTAVTHLTNRPDGGNGGTWAYDSMTRTLTIKVTGTPGNYTDTATVTDKGRFAVIPGALTPNQAPGRYLGDRIALYPAVLAAMVNGTAHYSFTSTTLPSSAPNLGVPAAENDHGNSPAGNHTTGNWYKQAFASTTGGTGLLNDWSWNYLAVTTHGVLGFQQWIDSAANNDGNAPGDGNITG